MSNLVILEAAALAGGIASLSVFGIGSLLTPVVASQYGRKTAVGAVAIPHFIATLLRFWRLRSHVDRRVRLLGSREFCPEPAAGWYAIRVPAMP